VGHPRAWHAGAKGGPYGFHFPAKFSRNRRVRKRARGNVRNSELNSGGNVVLDPGLDLPETYRRPATVFQTGNQQGTLRYPSVA
jgi:hypothetical protein